MKNKTLRFFSLVIILVCAFFIYNTYVNENQNANGYQEVLTTHDENENSISIPKESNGNEFIIINDNVPFFTEEEYTSESYIKLNELDELGRTQSATMCAGPDTLATEERESIGMIKPSGWNQKRYDDLIEDKYLYNRCHLLGFQLSGLNAEEKNLITCTRQMNIGKMLDIENEITKYIKSTGNHVLYRVTPFYDGNDLVAYGCLMEAKSVEDDEISICTFVYNIQNGIKIDYLDGSSSLNP